MENTELNVVTGAFGFTGKYITQLLLSQGKRVLALTGHPDRPNPFGERVTVAPFSFADPSELARTIRGATAFFNTYWIRFPHGEVTFDAAVENNKALIKAAEEAGVRRFVHVSITNASEGSPLPYFRGKGLVEKAIINSRLSYAILRPAIIFGHESILMNNIAWLLRRYPIFAVPGSGQYKLRPIFVEDLARLAAEAARREDDIVVDAVGPEAYTFDDLVRLIKEKVHSRALIVHLRPQVALLLSKLLGRLVGDVLLTEDEVEGLMGDLLDSDGPVAGHTRFSEWLDKNAASVGVEYMSELKRHYRPKSH